MNCYRIKNWNDHYENNRTRELQDLKWFPCPIQLSGDGYTLIMDRSDGASIFGAWIATAELAATCEPRGTLIRSAGIPHDAASISRQTRMPIKLIEKMLSFCMSNCNWLELIDLQSGAIIPQEGAIIPQEGAGKPPCIEGIEGKEGKEGKGREEEVAVPIPVHLKDVWSAFIDVRKSLKAVNNTRAIKMLLTELNKLSKDPAIQVQIVEQSIRSSWKDVYKLKNPTPVEQPKKSWPHPPDSYGRIDG